MSKKNIKVSEVVYDRLVAEKEGNESFDDTLRRILELSPDIEDLAAYYPDEMREMSKEIVEFIFQMDDFKRNVNRGSECDTLKFIPEDSDLAVAQIQFWEDSLKIMYRNKNGDMDWITSLVVGNDKDTNFGYDLEGEFDELKEEIKRKIKGAIRKWAGS